MEIWEGDHERALAVYMRAQWTFEVSPAGQVVYMGMSTTEIAAVATVLGYRMDAGLLDDVQTLIRAAMPLYNEKKR